MIIRRVYQEIRDGIIEPRRFIQVLMGPRQIGKTTLVHQLAEQIDIPSYFTTADNVAVSNTSWIEQQWEVARQKIIANDGKEFLLIIDEILKH